MEKLLLEMKIPYYDLYLKGKDVPDEAVHHLIKSGYGKYENISCLNGSDRTLYLKDNKIISKEKAYCILRRWMDYEIWRDSRD